MIIYVYIYIHVNNQIIDIYIIIDIECDKSKYHKNIYIRSKVVQTMPSPSVHHPAVLRIDVAHELTLGVAEALLVQVVDVSGLS